jgi:branched-chain amino acid transport system permease protein
MVDFSRIEMRAAIVLFGALALAAPVVIALDASYYLLVLSRIFILALAATGLNLIMGYGGLVSMGHSLYVGLGAYMVGILASHGVVSGPLHLLIGLAVGAALSTLIGVICVRTSGMAFIMITLAFSQMAYFLVIALKTYGGDDGMVLAARSAFGFIDLENGVALYYAILIVLAAAAFLVARLVHARFGLALRATKSNPKRVVTLGLTPFWYRLVAYVISAELCVVAGFFLANLTKFVSPTYLHWILSGDLIVIVVIGGMGTVLGPILGAIALIVIEEVLTSFSIPLPFGIQSVISAHFLAIIGAFILIIALNFRNGLFSLFSRIGRA